MTDEDIEKVSCCCEVSLLCFMVTYNSCLPVPAKTTGSIDFVFCFTHFIHQFTDPGRDNAYNPTGGASVRSNVSERGRAGLYLGSLGRTRQHFFWQEAGE